MKRWLEENHDALQSLYYIVIITSALFRLFYMFS